MKQIFACLIRMNNKWYLQLQTNGYINIEISDEDMNKLHHEQEIPVYISGLMLHKIESITPA